MVAVLALHMSLLMQLCLLREHKKRARTLRPTSIDLMPYLVRISLKESCA